MEIIRKFSARNGMEISLRLASPDDSTGIIKTLKSPAPERSYVLTEQVGKSVQAERTYLTSLNTEKDLLLVATNGSEIVGVMAVLQADEGRRPESVNAAHIGLHIMEAYRGFGIGSQMLKYGIEWAQEHGFKMLAACIFTTNMSSLNIFKKTGFTEECSKSRKVRFGKECIAEVCLVKCLD
ncbi:MAG: N-acetyltransferase family protein [Dissulfurispiraceae bacterium]|jgi:L-amino acid N-acyltransferase YncA